MQAKYGENEIRALLNKLRIFNREIGAYELFAITDKFDYAVELSNGKILIKLDELLEDEREALTPEHLETIANRFISSSSTLKNENQDFKEVNSTNSSEGSKKKTGIVKPLALATGVLILFWFGVDLLQESKFVQEETYEQKVMTIGEIERAQPTNFLIVNGTYRENFWGDKLKVTCDITNTATVASYKDVVIRITYFTKTNTELASKDYSIYEIFPPNSTKTVELKIENFQNVSTIDWQVISALPY